MENVSAEQDNKALQFIEKVTSNADEVQSQVLSQILSANAHTHYLTRFRLDGRTDRSSFNNCLPVIAYEDVEEDILRIANGGTSPILSANNSLPGKCTPTTDFFLDSGTSGGERELIPMPEDELERTFLSTLLMHVIKQYMQGLDKGKGMYFLFLREEYKTPGGLPARSMLTSFSTSRYFRDMRDTYNMITSPIQLLCGLLHANEVFPPTLLRAMRFLEEHWKEMCRDIARGTLDEEVLRWDPFVREAVTRLLHSNPELAKIVERECSKQSWKGVIIRLWPNTKYIDTLMTGSLLTGAMAQYIPTLDYYNDCLPLVSNAYGSSECYIGINLQPFCEPSRVFYTVLPNFAGAFYSGDRWPIIEESSILLPLCIFRIPFVNNCNDPTPTNKNNRAEQGEEYEIMVTTYEGLYRYKVGTVLRVMGFHNAVSEFHFVHRKNVVFNID
eukprot:Gb_31645 [translate_table: standard]